MAVPNDIQYGRFAARRAALADDDGQAQTKTLGVLVAVMVVAGVVALVLTLFDGNSNNTSAAAQPSGSQVGKQTTSAPSSTAPSSTAASAPSSTSAPTTTPATSAPTTTKPAATKPATTTTPKPAKTSASTGTSTKIVKYTVKKGDNLTVIAKWFDQRGVAPVYDWNKSVIGKNPNLIYPGQTIIVSLTGDKMHVSTKNK